MQSTQRTRVVCNKFGLSQSRLTHTGDFGQGQTSDGQAVLASMPRSFLIKKHGKEEYLGQGNSRVPSDGDMSGDTVDADRVTEMDTATQDSYTEDDEYLDVESLDQEDVLIKGSEVLQRQTGVLMEGRPCPSRPPSGHSEDQLQPEDLSQKGPSGSSELSRMARLGPAGQTSPQGGVVPVPRQTHREKTSPDAGQVLRVPGRKLLLSPYEFTSTPPPLCRPAVGESPLNLKYSDPRFWMAGLPGLPAYIPGMHPLFPVPPTTLSTQLMSQHRMNSPSALQIRASLSAFRSPQDQVTPYPFPETAGGSLVAHSSCLPFQPPYPYSHSSRPHPSSSADGLSLPRTVFTNFVRGPGQRERATIMDRKENRTPSPPLNWLLDAPYNLSTKSSSAPSSPGKAAPPQKRPNDPPRYQCEACNKSYATFSGLSKHKQFHCETQIKKEFTCKYCDKTYTSLGALKMHIRTHTLPCKCQICGKAFSRPWLLQGHVRTHTGEKPFTCPHCGRAFADRSNLRAHLQTHSDVKKYSCKTCAKTFSRMSLLLKHEDGSCPGLRPSISVIPV